MKLLALDTSTLRAAVALADLEPGGSIAVTPAASDATARHGRDLLPSIRDLLADAGVGLADVGAIAVGIGPGSYTGLRIGLTAAKTLAYATGARLIGLDSLELIAYSAPPDAVRVAVAADAQRGDVYVAEFRRASGLLERISPTRIETAVAWAATIPSGTWVLGPALDRLGVIWPEGVIAGTVNQGHPQPEGLIELTRAAVHAGQSDEIWTLEPAYFRRSAAEDQWDRRP